ncbi:ATP/GTP-binding protein [Kutzneria sp. 744]|uniref:GTP-binding protein n=1 Tax=Kutzneria sp. (strain 744) TaxID=345341 RepID=UPI0012FCA82C|nr:hypothetical protein [Kutzneria sp. 744]
MDLRPPATDRTTMSVKIVVVGGPRAGKTAFLRSAAAAAPSTLPGTAIAADATDFVRVQLDEELALHLVTAAGPALSSTWGQFGTGAVGVVLLVDNRRVADACRSVAFLAGQGLPYVVAVNRFDRKRCARIAEARQALGVDLSVPVLACDPRVQAPVRRTLVALIEHTIDRHLSVPRDLTIGAGHIAGPPTDSARSDDPGRQFGSASPVPPANYGAPFASRITL